MSQSKKINNKERTPNNPLEGISLLLCSDMLYRDLWDPFLRLFRRFFPEFSGDIYFSCPIPSNSFPGSHLIHGLPDKENSPCFSTRLLSTLKMIKGEYLLLALDDFFLCKDVQTDIIIQALEVMKADKSVGQISLHDSLSHFSISDGSYNDFFVVKKQKSPYKCNTQFALWKKTYLKKCLRKGENPWEFEFIGTYRANRYPEKVLYCKDVYHNAISYPKGGVVKRGIIKQELTDLYKPFGIDLQTLTIHKSSITNKGHHVSASFFAKICRRISYYYSAIYPKLSVKLYFLTKRAKGIPDYVFRENVVENLTILRDWTDY